MKAEKQQRQLEKELEDLKKKGIPSS